MKLLGVTLALFLVLAPTDAWASAEDQANDLSGEIMSPFCPAVTLHECPSDAAVELRERIVDWFEQGLTRAQIMERLEDEYGSGISAVPAASGAGLGAWLLPALALLSGVALLTFLIMRWKRTALERTDSRDIGAADRARIEDELTTLRAQR